MATTVTLEWADGQTRQIGVEDGETVVDAADRVGDGIPYGCLTGACATCTGRLLDEDLTVADAFEYERPPRALNAEQATDGYVLLCIAKPRQDCRIEVGADVQADLLDNPWK